MRGSRNVIAGLVNIDVSLEDGSDLRHQADTENRKLMVPVSSTTSFVINAERCLDGKESRLCDYKCWYEHLSHSDSVGNLSGISIGRNSSPVTIALVRAAPNSAKVGSKLESQDFINRFRETEAHGRRFFTLILYCGYI